MNPKILNRSGQLPADGYYHIEALGEHVNHRARVVQVIDDQAVQTIVNRFAQEAAAEHFAGQRIDKDHLSSSEENPTEAMGWSKAVTNRADGLYAQIKWTPLGRPLIKPDNADDEPAYKFFSTEYDPGDCEQLGTRKIGNRTYAVVRPLRLAGLSLTNDPNNRGQRPISNRGGTDAGAADENQPAKTMKKVNSLLGLAEDASEDSAVAAIQAIQNRATTAEANNQTLTAERDGLLASQVEADLEKYAPVIANKEAAKKSLIANRAAAIEFFDGLLAAGKQAEGQGKPITNRANARTPEGGAQTDDEKKAAAEEARAGKIANRARQLREANPQLQLTKAYELAEAEFPAESAS